MDKGVWRKGNAAWLLDLPRGRLVDAPFAFLNRILWVYSRYFDLSSMNSWCVESRSFCILSVSLIRGLKFHPFSWLGLRGDLLVLIQVFRGGLSFLRLSFGWFALF